MNVQEYAAHDGLGLATLIAERQVSAVEVLEAALAASDLANPVLNIIAHDFREDARALARDGAPAGPFSGVPFLVKDLSMEMAGLPAECGSRLLAGRVAERDHNLMARFRAVGLVTFARTTTAEFGAQLCTETARSGITRNPWSLSHTPGGSSGGSTAAVASGVVPVAHANDGIGSIRVPAANTGLFGLKPTRQRTPSGPDFGETIGGRGSEFIVSRTVRDAAAMLDGVHGADVGAPCWAPPPARPYVDELAGCGRPLRVAIMTRTYSGAPVDPACVAAVESTGRRLEQLGHGVEPAGPAFDWQAYSWAIRTEALANFAAGMHYFSEVMQRPLDSSTLEPLNLLAVAEGARVTTSEYLRSIAVYGQVQRAMGAFFERFDLLLTPVIARPTARIGSLAVDPADFETYWSEFGGDAYSPFTGVFNITGHPAAAVPLHWTEDGLPIGVHLVGRFGDEATLIAIAADLERSDPWRDRQPPYHVARLAAAAGVKD